MSQGWEKYEVYNIFADCLNRGPHRIVLFVLASLPVMSVPARALARSFGAPGRVVTMTARSRNCELKKDTFADWNSTYLAQKFDIYWAQWMKFFFLIKYKFLPPPVLCRIGRRHLWLSPPPLCHSHHHLICGCVTLLHNTTYLHINGLTSGEQHMNLCKYRGKDPNSMKYPVASLKIDAYSSGWWSSELRHRAIA